MKTSNKLWIAAFGILFLFFLSFLIHTKSRIIQDNSYGDGRDSSYQWGELTKEYDLDNSGFNSINIKGKISLTIKKAESWSIHVREEGREDLEIEQNGDELNITTRQHSRGNVEISIGMPELSALRLKGAGELDFSGFDEPELYLYIKGAYNLEGRDSRIENLSVRVEGAGSLDLSEAPVHNADLDVQGIGSVQLTMTGGILQGTAKGIGSVNIEGEVGDNRLRHEGIMSVTLP